MLSLHRALLGEVPPALRGALVGRSPTAAAVVGSFDGPVSQDDQDAMSSVCAEFGADFPPPVTVDARWVHGDAPSRMLPPAERLS